MKYTTIIAEKPSVAKEIARIVGATIPHRNGPCGYIEGNNYRVTWAFGHLVQLLSPEEMGYGFSDIPMFPEQWKTKMIEKRNEKGKWETDPMIKTQMNCIKDCFFHADEIIVATDAGREGELIFRYIYEYLECKTPFRRLWISSLTDEAIKEGMASLKQGHDYNRLSDAAHLRGQADWLVGYNGSKTLRITTGFKGMISLGRVQTPTLGMICRRYMENRDFKPTPFWQVEVETTKDEIGFKAISEKKYESKAEADQAYQQSILAGNLTVENSETKRTSTKPPLLFDLTSLQRAANSKFGINADETLSVAQSLYEKKFITYPRTGSRYIPEDVFKNIPGLLTKIEGHEKYGKYASELKGKKLCKKSVDNAKVTDHHALLPTGNTPGSLEVTERHIYDMIIARLIEAFGEDFVADKTTAVLSAGETKFKTSGCVPIYMGWKSVLGKNDNEDDDTPITQLPTLTTGDILPINNLQILEKATKPKPIHTDNTLLGEMETCGQHIDDEDAREAMKECGIGTPATRANIISNLIRKKYVCRDKKKLIPTELGLGIWKMVEGRKIANVKTTGEWERDLALIEQGKKSPEEFSNGITSFVRDIINDLQMNAVPLDSNDTEPKRNCPICGKPMKNSLYSIECDANNGGCGLRISRKICQKELPTKAIENLVIGKTTDTIKGFISKNGKKFDAKLALDKENKKIIFELPKNDFENEPHKICPICGQTMQNSLYSLSCENCGLKIGKSICQKALPQKAIDALINGKTTDVIKGFTSKTGKKFDAKLKIDKENKKVIFEFTNK